MTTDDRAALSAEYALGTLDADDRVRAETLMRTDPEFATLVRDWERRLGELHAMVAPVEPPPQILAALSARLSGAAQGPLRLPEAGRAAPRMPATTTMSRRDASPRRPTAAPRPQVNELQRRLRRWRGAAKGAGAFACALLAMIVAFALRPDLLPDQYRPKPVVIRTTVERVIEQPANQFVAVLQQGVSPAFILTVDLAKRAMTVRRVAAETTPGKSFELWLVSDRFPAPRSLGLVGAQDFGAPGSLADYDPDTISEATYAVSLEPEGGSPSGAPTGPMLWTGKLVESVPPS